MSPGGDGVGRVTALLAAARAGDADAADHLLAEIYDDLRVVARRQLRREYAARTIEPTALVHEAYLKMVGGAGLVAQDRVHLLALAARAMRQVLVDQARRRTAAKRPDAWKAVSLAEAGPGDHLSADDLVALDDALGRLDPRQRTIVECRFFGGLSEAEIGELLGVTERTVRREWVRARARLHRDLYGRGDETAS